MCDAVFDQLDAEVVCRELDCGAPVQVLGAAAFDKGDTQMWTQEIQCRGNESQVHICPTSASHENNCHYNVVGLLCAGGKVNFLERQAQHIFLFLAEIRLHHRKCFRNHIQKKKKDI